MNQVNPHNMKKSELRAWALELCNQWNWNADLLWIAHELRDSYDIKPDSREFEILAEEFNKFFNNPTIPLIEAVKVVLGDIS